MERETRNHYQTRGSARGVAGPGSSNPNNPNGEGDMLLQWGNRKRVRCTKTQRRDDSLSFRKPPVAPSSSHPDRRVLRRTSPNHARSIRNNSNTTEEVSAMRGTSSSSHHHHHSNGVRGLTSPEKTAKAAGNGGSAAIAGVSEEKKGSSSGSEGYVWPKFNISLTNKEKEEDFLVFKGSKLPQRPKKRAKMIQRTINLVSPGLWLCDLTLERYEVREKKVSKKRPRGLKAMHNMESDSE
ncbi:hypothetical protein LUZ60_000349 [Juncus effusus]|nr:hypothetical protein LUZ60_000349 [Juncus effusus]